jgi:PAS domain S-box-containing protein
MNTENTGKPRVLLVDDMVNNLVVLEAILDSSEFELVKCFSGSEAINEVQKSEFAVVLLDVRMPGLDGVETARQIRKAKFGQTVPFIFIMAEEADAFIENAYKLGAVDCITKPVKAYALKAKVSILVELFNKTTLLKIQGEKLYESENQKKDSFLENALDAVIGMNQQGMISDWTSRAEEIFGWTKVEVLNKKLSEIIIPEKYREAHERGMAHFLKTNIGPILNTRIEVTALKKDKSEIPIELTVTPVKTDRGFYFYSFVRDISDRKKLDQIVRESEIQFRTLADSIPQLAWMANPDGYIFWYNQRWFQYTGKSFEEMEGWGWQSVHDEKELPRVLESWKISIATGIPFELEFPLLGADGVFRWFLTQSTPIKDDLGKVIRWFGTNTDISERRYEEVKIHFLAQATTLLSSSLDYKKTLQSVAELTVQNLADWCGIDIIEHGEITPKSVATAHPNPEKLEWAKMLNEKYPPDWSSSTGAPNVIRTGKSELYSEIPEDLLKKAAKNDEHYSLLMKLKIKSAMVVPLKARGKIFGAITFIGAESGRRYTKADLKFAEDLADRAAIAIDNSILYLESTNAVKAREDFLSVASHELKTPLSSIKMQIQMLKRAIDQQNVVQPEKLAKAILISGRQIDRLTNLVDNLLDVSRIEAGKLSFNFEEVNLSELISDFCYRFSDLASASNSKLEANVDSNIIGWLDRFKMEQVILNLLSNAIKYGDGKSIRVSLVKLNENAELEVRDHGIGIAGDKLNIIFERFERAVNSTNISGLGLGLFITSQIVERMNGSIKVESELGSGSTFKVQLPLKVNTIDGDVLK